MNVFELPALLLLLFSLGVRLIDGAIADYLPGAFADYLPRPVDVQPSLAIGLGLHVLAGLMRLLFLWKDWGPVSGNRPRHFMHDV